MTSNSHTISWPPLLRGTLVKRYKRFLADVVLDDGREVTAHCPNSGSMAQCSQPGRPVYLSEHNNPKRKLKFTWELIEMPTSLVGVNTLVPNRLVAGAAAGGLVPELAGYEKVRTEVNVGDRSRLDLMLCSPERSDCYIEIKNCTLVENGIARFPDARTVRGQKHLDVLIKLKNAGARAVIFFVVQRTDATIFTPADTIDPDYGRILRQVVDQGVEMLAYDTVIDLKGISLNKRLAAKL